MANVLGELFGNIADAIREKTGDTATMKPAEFPAKISGIEVGGGSSADVRYVTFMSRDGKVEYGKKAVAVGDDCANPIARGVFSTPTRESDVQYNYTFAGWATTPNGALNANALKAVTEDRTVYANFAAVVRYYTITYYDGDTVLKTISAPYGATIEPYSPKKDGFSFAAWSPEVTEVTGDASYYAQWSMAVTFAGSTWADIAQACESGRAAECFSVGDQRTIQVTWKQTGAKTDAVIEIIGINHDDLADGSGKAGITIGFKDAFVLYYFCTASSTQTMGNGWASSTTRTEINSTGLANLPSDMAQHIKEVTKLSRAAYNSNTIVSSVDKLFVPSSTEYTGHLGYGAQGTQYEHFKTLNNRKKHERTHTGAGTSYENHFTRTPFWQSGWLSMIDNGGNYRDTSMYGTENETACICFCI